MNKFATGDTVRNVSHVSECYGLTGTFMGYWRDKPRGELLTLRNACDVQYDGKTGPAGYPYIAQSADDLEKVSRNDEGENAVVSRLDCKRTRRHVYIDDTIYAALSKDAAQRFEAISAWIEDACKQKLQREK